jgi:hypothetical protein
LNVAGVDALRLDVVVPAFVMVPHGRELHAAASIHVGLVGELVFVVRVSEDRIGDPGVYPLEHMLFVDRRVDTILPEHRDGDDGHFLR